MSDAKTIKQSQLSNELECRYQDIQYYVKIGRIEKGGRGLIILSDRSLKAIENIRKRVSSGKINRQSLV